MIIGRDALLRVLGAIPFGADQWVVAGSSPMLMAGLVDSISDVDIVVDSAAWDHAVSLCDRPPREGLLGDQMLELRVSGATIEVFDGWLGSAAQMMIAEADEIEGYRFSPLSRVLDSKRRLLRDRDVVHISILEAQIGMGQKSGAESREPAANSRRSSPD